MRGFFFNVGSFWKKSSWPSNFFTQLSMMNHLKTCRLFKALAFKSILDQDVLVGVLLVLAPLYLEPMGSGASLHVPEEVSQLIPEPPAKDAWQGRNFPSSFVFLRVPDLVKLEKKWLVLPIFAYKAHAALHVSRSKAILHRERGSLFCFPVFFL